MPDPSQTIDLGPPGQVLGVRAYRVGTWNGEPTTPEEVAELVANYALFVQPQGTGDPYYVPFTSLAHSDLLSFGRVSRVVKDGEFLTLDLDGVPLAIRKWMRSGKLTYPSVEVWRPGTFSGPDGSLWPTHVLRGVTLLGAEAPGAKGLPPLSAAEFPGLDDDTAEPTDVVPAVLLPDHLKSYRDYAASVRKFSDLPPATRRGVPMFDKAAVMKQFADLPDDKLREFAAKCFGDDADKDKPKEMSDDEKEKEDEKVKEYRDRAGKAATEAEELVKALKAHTDAAAAASKAAELTARKALVKQFRDEMTGAATGTARMTPVQFDAIEAFALTLDHVAVKKFADGKAEGTALAEYMGQIRAAYPTPVKKFGDQLPAGGSQGLAADRRAALLAKTPEGQAVLAREKAAAK